MSRWHARSSSSSSYCSIAAAGSKSVAQEAAIGYQANRNRRAAHFFGHENTGTQEPCRHSRTPTAVRCWHSSTPTAVPASYVSIPDDRHTRTKSFSFEWSIAPAVNNLACIMSYIYLISSNVLYAITTQSLYVLVRYWYLCTGKTAILNASFLAFGLPVYVPVLACPAAAPPLA